MNMHDSAGIILNVFTSLVCSKLCLFARNPELADPGSGVVRGRSRIFRRGVGMVMLYFSCKILNDYE